MDGRMDPWRLGVPSFSLLWKSECRIRIICSLAGRALLGYWSPVDANFKWLISSFLVPS